METNGIDLELLKRQLMGSNLKKLLSDKGLTKWRLAKDTGVTYHTILNWQKEFCKPSDENAKKAGKYLGLISPDEFTIADLKRKQEELNKEIKRLTSE